MTKASDRRARKAQALRDYDDFASRDGARWCEACDAWHLGPNGEVVRECPYGCGRTLALDEKRLKP